jgi:hypothetical protein
LYSVFVFPCSAAAAQQENENGIQSRKRVWFGRTKSTAPRKKNVLGAKNKNRTFTGEQKEKKATNKETIKTKA